MEVLKSTKVLWVRPDAIGDAILSSSMLPYIKNHYNNAQIMVVCQQHLAELYQACPFVSDVIGFDKKNFVTDQVYRESMLARLRDIQFDYALNSVYSREASMESLSTAVGAKHIVWLDNDGGYKPELARHKDFLAKLGVWKQGQPALELSPHVWMSQADEIFAQNFFAQHELKPSTTIAFFAGAQSAHRLYTQYGQALQKAFAEQDVSIIVLGAKSDAQINATNTVNFSFKSIDLSGLTTLTQTAALLKRCRLAFGAETGLAHMACAVGIPHVILLGGGHLGRFMPYSPLTSAVILPLACAGCDWRCKYKKAYCVQDVHADVLAYALQYVMQHGMSIKPRVFVQGRNRYRSWFFKPRWQMPQNLLDMSAVEIVMV